MSTKPSNKAAKHTASFADIDPNKITFAEKSTGSLFWNARRDWDDKYMVELRESIRSDGLLEEIVVRLLPNGSRQVVCGERRLRSILKLLADKAECHDLSTGAVGPAKTVYKTVKAKVLQQCSDKQASRISVTENLKRKQLSDLELMAYCRDLCDCELSDKSTAYSRDDVCHIINRSQAWVSQTMSLFDLPLTVQRSLECGKLGRTVALGLLKVEAECVEKVLRVADMLAAEECEEYQEQLTEEVGDLEDELNTAKIDLTTAAAAGTSNEQKAATKARTLAERKLTEAKSRQNTASKRDAHVTTDTITRATDQVPGARVGKSNGMSQKAVRTEVQKVRKIIDENEVVANAVNNERYDKRDISFVILGMEMVLGSAGDRAILDAIARRYALEKRDGWEQFQPPEEGDKEPAPA